jgi:ATP-dependent DNA helicase HFM1/MER3
LSSPTGSGKTVVFEISIVRELKKRLNDPSYKGKILFVAPIKALCQQILGFWEKKFAPFGLSCVELTGDSENVDISTLNKCDLILVTPEKLVSVLRY